MKIPEIFRAHRRITQKANVIFLFFLPFLFLLFFGSCYCSVVYKCSNHLRTNLHYLVLVGFAAITDENHSWILNTYFNLNVMGNWDSTNSDSTMPKFGSSRVEFVANVQHISILESFSGRERSMNNTSVYNLYDGALNDSTLYNVMCSNWKWWPLSKWIFQILNSHFAEKDEFTFSQGIGCENFYCFRLQNFTFHNPLPKFQSTELETCMLSMVFEFLATRTSSILPWYTTWEFSG